MKFIITVFTLWRITLFLAAWASIKFLPLREGFLGGGTEKYLQNPLLWGWANMDGVHYLSIAQNGYMQYEQAFFPLYPLLIRYLAKIMGGNYLVSGLLISNIAFLGGLIVFYSLLKKEYSDKIAKWGIVLLLIFPTSFFLGSVYTESLFLFLVLGSFYAAQKNKWLITSILGGFSSATRLAGIFLLPTLLYEWWKKKGSIKPFNHLAIYQLISIIIFTPLGLFSYMWYLRRSIGDPLFFFHAQPAFGAGRSGGQIILLPQVLYRYFKIFFTASFSYNYIIAAFELASLLLALYLLIKNIKTIAVSYQIFAWFAIITPTLTGSLSSMPRYILTVFPIFITLAQEGTKFKIVFLVLSSLFLVLSTMFFFRGYFIA